jgi:phosphate transport system permease protein
MSTTEAVKSNPFADDKHTKGRNDANSAMTWIFLSSTIIAVIFLIIMMLNIFNGTMGFVAVEYEVEPGPVIERVLGSAVPEDELTREQLLQIIRSEIRAQRLLAIEDQRGDLESMGEDGLRSILADDLFKARVQRAWSFIETFNSIDIELGPNPDYDPTESRNISLMPNPDYDPEEEGSLRNIPNPEYDPVSPVLYQRTNEIDHYFAMNPEQRQEYRVWISLDFLTSPQASEADVAGIRTALFGSFWMILITYLVAVPLGVGAAIYLQEYAKDNWFNRLIQTNIYNLAGVPSIIYGLLGLAVFVRGFGIEGWGFDRTILSAGLTLSLLILPIIIINSQEALKAIPDSLRMSSYGLGATKWETVFHHLLPASLDRILTGTILAISRAIGETAPLIVVGASTAIFVDPSWIFDKFTVMPIQIYQWTAKPQSEFKFVAAGAIVVLLILLLAMNTAAITIRNNITKKKRLGL